MFLKVCTKTSERLLSNIFLVTIVYVTYKLNHSLKKCKNSF